MGIMELVEKAKPFPTRSKKREAPATQGLSQKGSGGF